MFDDLQEIADDLQRFDAAESSDAKPIDGERTFRQRLEKQSHVHRANVGAAVKILDRLPEPGEVLHCLMSGSFEGWDYVSAVLELAAPATIDTLHIATLGFNSANAGELLALLDSRKVRTVWMLASCYMRDSSAELYLPLAAALKKRGQHIKATRNHCKILCFALSDGRRIVVTGSMNLRSCKNIELSHVWNSPDFHQFCVDYIEEGCRNEEEVK